jgi:Penicillinase repressor
VTVFDTSRPSWNLRPAEVAVALPVLLVAGFGEMRRYQGASALNVPVAYIRVLSRGAYNTILTVLNRLAERGLLSRHKSGNAVEYLSATPRSGVPVALDLAHARRRLEGSAASGPRAAHRRARQG